MDAGGRCTTTTPAVCTDGPATKVVDGVAVTRDCWEYRSTMSCSGGASADQCALLVAAGCTPQSSTCRQTNAVTGVCEVFEDGYRPCRTSTRCRPAAPAACPPATTARGSANEGHRRSGRRRMRLDRQRCHGSGTTAGARCQAADAVGPGRTRWQGTRGPGR
ncbi:conjugal transfer protein TraN (plasmid) [Sphaerotilus sulfidivorans]